MKIALTETQPDEIKSDEGETPIFMKNKLPTNYNTEQTLAKNESSSEHSIKKDELEAEH